MRFAIGASRTRLIRHSMTESLLLALLGGALGLFLAAGLLAVDAGFSQKGVVIADLDLFRRVNVPYAARVTFKQDLLQKIRALPGVGSAAEVDILPLSGSSTENVVWIEGTNPASGLDSLFNSTSDGYFKAMVIALLTGRDFSPQDTVSSPKVAIVNQTFARKLGLGMNPIGKTFRRQAIPTEPEQSFEIVGLVTDTQYSIPACAKNFAPSRFSRRLKTPGPAPLLNS